MLAFSRALPVKSPCSWLTGDESGIAPAAELVPFLLRCCALSDPHSPSSMPRWIQSSTWGLARKTFQFLGANMSKTPAMRLRVCPWASEHPALTQGEHSYSRNLGSHQGKLQCSKIIYLGCFELSKRWENSLIDPQTLLKTRFNPLALKYPPLTSLFSLFNNLHCAGINASQRPVMLKTVCTKPRPVI